MPKKILVAGLLAGLALFVWESLAHTALGLGEAGIKALPHEPVVLTALKENIKEAGFYFFPAPEDKPAMMMLAGPSGIMVINPNGDPGLTPGRLILQAVLDILSMLLAGFVLSRAVLVKGYGARVAFVAMFALFPALRTELPQWNWYGFPAVFTAAQFTIHLVGFILGGLVLAKMVKAE